MPLDIAQVRARFPGRDIHFYPSLPSTMPFAAQLASASAPHGTAVVADEQTAGQGRHGRSWHSEPENGLYVSLVLRLPFSASAFPALTLAIGLAARDAIEEITGGLCDLRWPNDLLLNERKCGGILLSLESGAVIAGIGINVNHPAFPADLTEQATSLRIAAGKLYSREALLIALLSAIDRYCELISTHGIESILRLFSANSTYASGRRVVVDQTGEHIEGTTAGLDEHGFLRVRRDNGTVVKILAGGVRPLGDA
jgi:BirA family biotin operon repressor/biotin-[acetyl-CoA-carboxylase] ligase